MSHYREGSRSERSANKIRKKKQLTKLGTPRLRHVGQICQKLPKLRNMHNLRENCTENDVRFANSKKKQREQATTTLETTKARRMPIQTLGTTPLAQRYNIRGKDQPILVHSKPSTRAKTCTKYEPKYDSKHECVKSETLPCE